jgi:hypothetical protein
MATLDRSEMTEVHVSEPVRPPASAQWGAVAFAIVAALLLAIGLPQLADSSAPEDVAVTAGEPVAAGGVAVTPPDGWALAAGTPLLVLNKEDAKFTVLPPTPSTQSPEESVREQESGYSDGSVHTTVGEVQTFTTESGLEAASVIITQPDLVTVVYAFSDGQSLATGSAFFTPNSWPTVQDEVDAMAATVAFVPEAAS